jgi:hypothetical protein
MRRTATAFIAAIVLLAAGCSDGKTSAGGTTSALASTVAAGVTGGVAPSVATTAIPGAGGATPPASPGGTVAPQATTTIPLTPTPTAAGAPVAPAAPASSAPTGSTPDPGATTPAATSPPVTDIVDGNPDMFCPAVEQAVPLYYVMSLGRLDGESSAAAYEVAVAPALSVPLTQAATSAPSVVAPPFKQWAARTALAVAAFKAAGATDAQVASFGQSYAAQIEALTDAGGAQSPPDPIDAAARAGIDRNRLVAAAKSFVQTNGSFEAFAATLSQDVTLTPAAQQKLEQLYPCAADLSNFTG